MKFMTGYTYHCEDNAIKNINGEMIFFLIKRNKEFSKIEVTLKICFTKQFFIRCKVEVKRSHPKDHALHLPLH